MREMLRLAVMLAVIVGCSASVKATVEHAVDDEEYSSRGRFVLQTNLRESPSKGVVMRNEFESLPEAFSDLNAAKAYRVRIPVLRVASGEIQTGGSFQGHIDGYIPVANLQAACFAHEIHLFMDQLGTAYAFSVVPLTCSNSTRTTPVQVFQTETVPGPDTKGFLQKVEEERARKARQPVDNRSFFQKYWIYIIVGLFAFTLLSNAGNQQGGEGGGQG